MERWKCGSILGSLMTSKNSSFKYSGHKLESLILGIVVCFRISRKSEANWDSSGLVELLHPHAAMFTPVKTTSLHPFSSDFFISSTISSELLLLCFPLFCTVRQKLQWLSHQFWITINFFVNSFSHWSSVISHWSLVGDSGNRVMRSEDIRNSGYNP